MTRLQSLLSIADLDRVTANAVIEHAQMLERHVRTVGALPPFLRGKVLAMVFDETSLRTRNAFERAMCDLGGSAIHFSGAEARVGRHADKCEHLPDFVRVVSAFNDALLTRIYDHAVQERISKLASVPFINGMCNLHHPTQALCDFLTIRRRLGDVKGLKIGFVGDGTNVATSLAQLAGLLGSSFHIATPPGWGCPVELIQSLPGYTWTADPEEAARDADVIIGDVWVPMNKGDQAQRRREALAPYRITTELMDLARPHAFFMHNLPANRGDEVVPEVIDGPRSAIYEEAVARLHIARALLLHMLHSDPHACMTEIQQALACFQDEAEK